MNKQKCVVLMTAKSSGSEPRDHLFLVRGTDDTDCIGRFHAFATDAENRSELGLDIRTIKYLGDGPDQGCIEVVNECGVVELDTSNNTGYIISVNKDA